MMEISAQGGRCKAHRQFVGLSFMHSTNWRTLGIGLNLSRWTWGGADTQCPPHVHIYNHGHICTHLSKPSCFLKPFSEPHLLWAGFSRWTLPRHGNVPLVRIKRLQGSPFPGCEVQRLSCEGWKMGMDVAGRGHCPLPCADLPAGQLSQSRARSTVSRARSVHHQDSSVNLSVLHISGDSLFYYFFLKTSIWNQRETNIE